MTRMDKLPVERQICYQIPGTSRVHEKKRYHTPNFIVGKPNIEGGGGRTHSLLALVMSPSTTHPFRDGAPFLLLIETPPTLRRS